MSVKTCFTVEIRNLNADDQIINLIKFPFLRNLIDVIVEEGFLGFFLTISKTVMCGVSRNQLVYIKTCLGNCCVCRDLCCYHGSVMQPLH